MNRTLALMLSICLLAVPASGIVRQVVNVPLEYNYLPGEPFWAKYGAVDGRSISLWVGTAPERNLGNFFIEGAENFLLVPQSGVTDYIDEAICEVLSHYGVTIRKDGDYRLVVTPERLEIMTEDSDEDGDKFCVVKLRVDYYHPDSTLLFSAIVENEGSDDIDDDDELAYADFLDRTLHGAIVKIWGSQILYTKKKLGSGRIRKIDRGTFAFFTDTTVNIPPQFPQTGTSWRVSRHGRFVASHPGSYLTPDASVDRTVITGARGDDTVVVVSGRRISLGILPFENGTGNEKLTALVKSAQERFSATLSHSGTIRILERGKLNDILKEQALGMSGIMNDSTVVKIGNLSGLQVMIAGNITTTGSYYRLSARIINVETSAIVATSSLLVPDALQIDDAGAELAAQLLFKFTEEKLDINRNTMTHPSIVPRATAGATAAVEDAWAVEYNPAAIMKVALRDAAFFTTLAETFSGKTSEGFLVSTGQPPYSTMGLNLAYPINGIVGTGFGIRHYYQYPRLFDNTESGAYDLREEATAFTFPAAFGISPKLSIGASVIADIAEYLIQQPGRESVEGNAISCRLMFGSLFKLSERLKMAATYSSANIYEKTDHRTGGVTSSIERPSMHHFRIGTAMYPTRWFFFFADLEYRKYKHLSPLQPGFHLGMQLTAYGRPDVLRFLPQYGMLPIYLGYSHEPFDRLKNTQARYVSFGSGYTINNIYVQWAWRKNVQAKNERTIVLGSVDSQLRLTDYTSSAPLFLCVGYRF